MASTTEIYNPFTNVRVGGPKEKRIRRVELMGEHKPKPIYYLKATQSLDDEFLAVGALRNFFESRIGPVGDVYRPVDTLTFPKEFAFVGFYDPSHVSAAVQCLRTEQYINNVRVTGDEVKPWLLDLYPRNK